MPYLSNNYRYQPKSRLKSLSEALMFIVFSSAAILLTLLLLGWFSVSSASAAEGINKQLNYQGKLNTIAGLSVGTQTYNFRFRIYDQAAGGTLLWTERWNATSTQVSIVNGVFSVPLGSIYSLDNIPAAFWNTDSLYLQVDLDADVNGSWEETFGTRKRLTSAAYSFNSDAVDGFNATSTAAVANYLMALDANKVLNLFDGGVSSTYATTTSLYVGGVFRMTTTTAAGGGVIYVQHTPFLHHFADPTAEGSNTFLGLNAGNLTMSPGGGWSGLASFNTAVGENAFQDNTTGYRNTATGYRSLKSNTTGFYNSAFGVQALFSNTTGSYNTAVGLDSLRSNVTGDDNVAVGMDALMANTASRNTAVGSMAMISGNTGEGNTALGYYALRWNTSGGSRNVAIGYQAANYLADGISALTFATSSVYIGANVRAFGNNDNNAVVIGADAIGLGSNTVVLGNNSIITTALKGNIGINTTTPGGWYGEKLTVVGDSYTSGIIRLATTTSATAGVIYAENTPFIHRYGVKDVFVGDNAGNFTSTGYNNTGIGFEALANITSGWGNTVVGHQAMSLTTTGWQNAVFGSVAMYANTTGKQNTAIGRGALHDNDTGDSNTALGWNAGWGGSGNFENVTGNYNLFLGWNASPEFSNLNNAIAIGASSTVSRSNAMVLGGLDADGMGVSVGINTSTPGGYWSEKLTVNGRALISDGIYIGTSTDYIWLNYEADIYGPSIRSVSGKDLTIRPNGAGNVVFFGIGKESGVQIYGNSTTTGSGYFGTLGLNGEYIDQWSDISALSGDFTLAAWFATTTWAGDNDLLVNGNATTTGNFTVGTSTLVVLHDPFGTNYDRVGIGTASPTSQLNIVSEDVGFGRGIRISQYNDLPTAPLLIFSKSRGTEAVPATIISGDHLGGIFASAYTGSYFQTAGIGFLAKGTIDATHAPTDIVFSTSDQNINSIVSNEKMRLTYDGKLAIATTTPGYAFVIATTTNTVTGQFAGYMQVASLTNPSIFVIDNNGRVGIGTSTPNSIFQVYDYIDFDGWDFNTKVGYQAGKNVVDGANQNTYFGYKAGYSSSTASTNAAKYNSAFGYNSFFSNTTGEQNSAFGYQSLNANTSGRFNNAFGLYALQQNTTGNWNVAFGNQALWVNTIGDENLAFGGAAMIRNISGDRNTGIGDTALGHVTSTNYNTALGYAAGVTTVGSNNLFLGYWANITASASSSVNAIAIGANSTVGGSNMMALGGTGANAVNVGITTSTPAYKLTVVSNSADNSAAGFMQVASSTNPGIFIIGNNGNVGIATTTPGGTYGEKLTVNGMAYFTNSLIVGTSTNNLQIVLSSGSPTINGTAGKDLIFRPNGFGNVAFFSLGHEAGVQIYGNSTTTGSGYFGTIGLNNQYISSWSDLNAFTDALTLSAWFATTTWAGGNVLGVATSTAGGTYGEKLTVVGKGYFTDDLIVGTSTNAISFSLLASGNPSIQGTSGKDLFIRPNGNGNVVFFGIGSEAGVQIYGNATTTGSLYVGDLNIGGYTTSTFNANIAIANGKDLQVSRIYSYSPLLVNANTIFSGQAAFGMLIDPDSQVTIATSTADGGRTALAALSINSVFSGNGVATTTAYGQTITVSSSGKVGNSSVKNANNSLYGLKIAASHTGVTENDGSPWNSATKNVYGVYASSTVSGAVVGGDSNRNNYGSYAIASSTDEGSSSNYGSYGAALNGDNAYGVYGVAGNAVGANYGVYGVAGDNLKVSQYNYGGYFSAIGTTTALVNYGVYAEASGADTATDVNFGSYFTASGNDGAVNIGSKAIAKDGPYNLGYWGETLVGDASTLMNVGALFQANNAPTGNNIALYSSVYDDYTRVLALTGTYAGYFDGDTYTDGNATTTGNLFVTGELNAASIFTAGNLDIGGYVSSTLGLYTSDILHVGTTTATSTFDGNIQIAAGKNLQVQNIFSYSPLNINADLMVYGNATSSGSVYVGNDLTLGGYASSAAGLYTQGSGRFGGNLVVAGNVTTTNAFTVGSSNPLIVTMQSGDMLISHSLEVQSTVFAGAFISGSDQFNAYASITGTPAAPALKSINGSKVNGIAFANNVAGTANYSLARILMDGTFTEAGSGSHPLIANLAIEKPVYNAGVATVTSTAQIYIEGPMNAVVSDNNYAIYVDDGVSRFDGAIGLATSTPGGTYGEMLTVLGGSYFEGNATTTGNFNANDTLYVLDGKVGIGTSTPGQLYANSSLTVDAGTQQFIADFHSSIAGLAYFGIYNSNAAGSLALTVGSNDGYAGGLGYDNPSNILSLEAYDNVNALHINSGSVGGYKPIVFRQGSEVMRIDKNQNIGIGTSTPEAKLVIHKDGAVGSDVMFAITTSTALGDPSNTKFKILASGDYQTDGTLQSGDADYAEYFYTADTDLTAGEAVCIDITRDGAVNRCQRGSDTNIIGIVSTDPSILGNFKESYQKDPHYKAIALLGQIPAKISAENGAIRPGDALTSSATLPGYLMKANAGDSTVGVALAGISQGTGTIKVLISRKNKSLSVEQIEEKITQNIADMEIEDEVNLMVANAINSLDLDTEINEAVDPKLLILDSKLTVTAENLNNKIVAANNLVEQLQQAVDAAILRINNLDQNIADLGALASSTANLVNTLDQKIINLQQTAELTTEFMSNASTTLVSLQNQVDQLAQIINSQSSSTASLTVTDTSADELQTLVVRESATFYGTIIVKGEAGFEHKVTFHQDIEVKGKIYASADQAGTATIVNGATSTEIVFSQEYEVAPKVTATARTPVAIGIKDQSTKGFRVFVNDPVLQDLTFDWIVLAVKGSNLFVPPEPVIETPPEVIPPAEDPVVEPPAEDPVVEDPVVPPPADDAVAEEPVDEPPAEDPVIVETPPAEPAVETPVVETPPAETGEIAGAATP